MKPYRVFEDLERKEFLQVLKWAKKYRKFGVYVEAEDSCRPDCYDVKVFSPPIYTDILGNSAIKPGFTFMGS